MPGCRLRLRSAREGGRGWWHDARMVTQRVEGKRVLEGRKEWGREAFARPGVPKARFKKEVCRCIMMKGLNRHPWWRVFLC